MTFLFFFKIGDFVLVDLIDSIGATLDIRVISVCLELNILTY